jgi:hypothetical protein
MVLQVEKRSTQKEIIEDELVSTARENDQKLLRSVCQQECG